MTPAICIFSVICGATRTLANPVIEFPNSGVKPDGFSRTVQW
jgi:hypothetical protein